MNPLACPTCKTVDHVEVQDVSRWGEYLATCTNCYDCDCVGDPPRYVSRSLTGWGPTKDEAIESWNEAVEDAMTPHDIGVPS